MLGGHYFHFLPMCLLEGVTTLLLLLMHNAAFKHHFTLCLLRHYLQLVFLKTEDEGLDLDLVREKQKNE